MATGDTSDMLSRIRSVLPAGWFAEEGSTPILDAVLSGFGSAFAYCYSLIQFTITQARLSTATGIFIDLWAASWFGSFPRKTGEADATYIARIKANLFLVQATRPALVSAMEAETGQPPTQILEFMRAGDTGGWGTLSSPAVGGGGGYDQGGIFWGSLIEPGQFLLTQSPGSSGDTNAELYAAIEAVIPAGITAWTNLT